MRRLLVSGVLGVSLMGCSSDDSASGSGGSGGGGTGGSGGAAGASGAGATAGAAGAATCAAAKETEATAKRDACGFAAGALPADSLGCGRTGAQIPIDHIVIIMQENRSFDHYFQALPTSGQPDVEVAPAGTTQKAPDGSDVPFVHMDSYCFNDTNHGWSGSHEEYGDGAMGGFATANAEASDPTGARAIGYYDKTDLPFAHQLATTFGIGDKYFCSVLGPTWPNRMYLYAGSSFGHTTNTPASQTATLFKSLNDAGISWKSYKVNLPPEAMFPSTLAQNASKFVDIAKFATDAAAGTLPQVSFLSAQQRAGGANETSEHPSADMQIGQKWLYDQVKALMASPLWSKSAMFITYDENGGLYDHVPPPSACKPDDIAPDLQPNLGGFDRLGFRVPVFVISPYAKQKYVSHAVHSHTSILRFVEARFDLPALTGRDANSDAMLDFFDFDNPPFVTPPMIDEPAIDETKHAACLVLYPP